MKHLWTYLLPVVWSLLCFAQPLQAQEVVPPEGSTPEYGDFTVYVDVGDSGWKDCYFSYNPWNVPGGAFEFYPNTEKVSDSVYKFKLKGVNIASTKEIGFVFTADPSDPWGANQVDDMRTLPDGSPALYDGALYKVGEMQNGKHTCEIVDYKQEAGNTYVWLRGQFVNQTSEIWGADGATQVKMDWDIDRQCYTCNAPSAGDYMISLSGVNFWDHAYSRVEGVNTIPFSKPETANVKNESSGGFYCHQPSIICFDLEGNKLWYERDTTPGVSKVYIGGPFDDAANIPWGSVEPVEMSWDPVRKIYTYNYDRATHFSVSLSKHPGHFGDCAYNIVSGLMPNGNMPQTCPSDANMKPWPYAVMWFPVAGKVCVDLVNNKIWYENDLSTVYIAGSISGYKTFAEMLPVEGREGVFKYSVVGGSTFLMSASNGDNWKDEYVVFSPFSGERTDVPFEEPSTSNVWRIPGTPGRDFRLLRAATVYFDTRKMTVWADYGKVEIQFAFDRKGNTWTDGVVAFVLDQNGQWIQVAPYSETAGRTVFRYETEYGKYPSKVYFANKSDLNDNSRAVAQEFARHATYSYYNDNRNYYLYGTFADGGSTGSEGQLSTEPMKRDPVTGVYSMEVSSPVNFRVTSWTPDQSGQWWEADYCWVPRNATSDVVIPSRRPGGSNIVNSMNLSYWFKTSGPCTIYFNPDESAKSGVIWSSVAGNDGGFVLDGQLLGEDFAQYRKRFEPTGIENEYSCIVNVRRKNGEFGIRRIDAEGNTLGWYSAKSEAISEDTPVLHNMEYKEGKDGARTDNSIFVLRIDELYKFTFTHNPADPSRSSLKVEPYDAPSSQQSWDDYNFDVLLRGPMIFGNWGVTGTMDRTDVPGIWNYRIDNVYDTDYTNTNGESERFHFMFSTLSGEGPGEYEFWGPDGINSYNPATGVGYLPADGTPIPFGNGSLVGQNYVFRSPCTLYVDMVRRLAWVVVDKPLSDKDISFYFWDKGGGVYTDAAKFKWWDQVLSVERCSEIFLKDDNGAVISAIAPQQLFQPQQNREYNSDDPSQDGRQWIGYRYKLERTLKEEFFDESGNLKGKLWVRIKRNKDNNDVVIERPYVREATYTQGVDGSTLNEYYGNITYMGEPLVDIRPELRMIPSDIVVTTDHPGGIKGESLVYKYVNCFETAVEIDSESFPFVMDKVTYETTKVINGADNKTVEVTVGKPIENATIRFSKTNEATLSYGSIREVRRGSTGKAVITGIDHVNAAKEDNLAVRVTYTSEGMSFPLTKTAYLTDYKSENTLPDMQNSEALEPSVSYFYGDPALVGSDDRHYVMDAVVEHPFGFRQIMRETRAAYIGFEVEWLQREIELDRLPEENRRVATEGRPLISTFPLGWCHSRESWHREAFTDNHLAIRLHHVAHSNVSADDVYDHETKFRITWHLVVPVATEVNFEAGVEIPRAKGLTSGYTEENPYTGPISTGSIYSFTKDFTFNRKNAEGNVISGVGEVEADMDDASVEYYNFQGVRMDADNLLPGIYIRRQGSTATKVRVP